MKHKLSIIFYLAIGLILMGYPLGHVSAVTTIGSNISTSGTLTADGALKFTSGAANNYILSTDASGNAIWISVGTALGNSNTDSLPEGATNKYYSDAAVDARISAQKGALSGLATLDGAGKVPSGQLPSIALNNSYAAADIAARDALTPAPGDVAIVADDGSGVSRSYVWDSVGSNWLELLTPLSLYLTKANNLSDLADLAAARSNLGLGNVANVDTTDASNITSGALDLARITAGSNGDVLTMSGGAVIWTAPSACAETDPLSVLKATYTANGDLIYGTGDGTYAKLEGSAGFLKSTGIAAPTWSAISLTADVSGILPIANGGTGTTNGSITGTGALSFTSNTTNALTLDSGTTGAINIGNNANAKIITIGNSTDATSLLLDAGTGGVKIGDSTATAIINHYSATANFNTTDPDGNCVDNNITVTGAAVGDNVYANPSPAASGVEDVYVEWMVYISAADTVTIRICDGDGSSSGAGPTVGAQDWRIDVWKH